MVLEGEEVDCVCDEWCRPNCSGCMDGDVPCHEDCGNRCGKCGIC